MTRLQQHSSTITTRGSGAAAGLVLVLCLLSLGTMAACATDTIAMLTDLRGKAEVQIPGAAWRPATIMMFLPAGAQLRLPAGTTGTVALMRGGARWRLSGPVTITVTGDVVKLAQGSPSSVQGTTPAARAAVLLPGNVDIQRMGGVRSRADSEITLKVDDTLADVRPTLCWQAPAGFERFEISIEEQEGFTTCFKGSASGDSRQLALPAESALQWGKQYLVHLVGYRKGGGSSAAATRDVEVIDKAAAERVQAARQEAEVQFSAIPDDVTPLVLLISIYAENSLTTPALELTQRVSALRPEVKTFYQLMGKLYERQHDPARAAEMYRKSE